LKEEHYMMTSEKAALSSPSSMHSNMMWPITASWVADQQAEAAAPGAIWQGDSFTSTKVQPRVASGLKPRKRTNKKKLVPMEASVDSMQVNNGEGTYYALQPISWPVFQTTEIGLLWDPIGENDISADALTSAQCSGMYLQSRAGMEAAATMYNGGILLFSAPVLPWVAQPTHTFVDSLRTSDPKEMEHALKQAQPDFYED